MLGPLPDEGTPGVGAGAGAGGGGVGTGDGAGTGAGAGPPHGGGGAGAGSGAGVGAGDGDTRVPGTSGGEGGSARPVVAPLPVDGLVPACAQAALPAMHSKATAAVVLFFFMAPPAL